MLQLVEVSKRFGGFTAVDRCSYSVVKGQITCLIGPNGAGKTTSFNLISGLFRPDFGEIRFKGRRIQGHAPASIARLGIGRTFQVPRELNDITVLESVKMAPVNDRFETVFAPWFARPSLRRREKELQEQAEATLAEVGLEAKMHTPVRALSGGQKKLLELARAIAFGAELIMLDEPTAGVNPALIDELVKLLLRQRDNGLTFFIVEHNMDFVRAISDHVIVMAEGRTLLDGSFADIRANPDVINAYLGVAV